MAKWYCAGLATARSWVRIPPTAAVHQRQLSVPSLRGRLMSTSESWGVNGHTRRCTSPVSVLLRLRLVSGWRLVNGDSAASWALEARERTLLVYCTKNVSSRVFKWKNFINHLIFAVIVITKHQRFWLMAQTTEYLEILNRVKSSNWAMLLIKLLFLR